VEVRVGFDELDPRILPDMGVKVAFQDEAEPDRRSASGVLVPARALREDQGRTIAWVVSGGRAERRAVSTGRRQDDDILVTAGLSSGERVIVNAPAALREGAAVKEISS